uniref:Uncharacterized protein n=1 Tax=Megaselia scalaris TaxID=36166 RepID=T1GSI3_MEGSC
MKPLDPKKYLKDLIEELIELSVKNCLKTTIKVGIFIFDAVASAFIRGVVSHNAYRACPKCSTTGSYHGRMCYPALNEKSRTDTNFRNRTDPEHHNEKFREPNSSALEALDVDIVKSCPNDYMHLILLGVTKKFLKMILKRIKFPKNALLRMKLDKLNISNISNSIALAHFYQPSDFCRQIRDLEYINFFKAIGGKLPLQELANRVTEHAEIVAGNLKKQMESKVHYPTYTKNKLSLTPEIIVSNDHKNCWILTEDKEIRKFEKVVTVNGEDLVAGKAIKNKTDYFEIPIKSSILDIFHSNGELQEASPIKFSKIQCKLFCIPDINNDRVFIPILHTTI